MCCLVRVPFHMLYLRLSKVLESMNRALNDICDRDLGSSGATKSARHHFWVCFKNHVPNAHVPCKRGCHVHCFSLCLQWSQRQTQVLTQRGNHWSLVITNDNTNTNSLKVRENCGIHVDFVPWEGWRNPTGIRLVLELWACKVDELEIVKYGASLVDYLLASLSWGPKSCLDAFN